MFVYNGDNSSQQNLSDNLVQKYKQGSEIKIDNSRDKNEVYDENKILKNDFRFSYMY